MDLEHKRATEELARQGRPGSALIPRLLAERATSYRAPESNLEARFESILEDACVTVPSRQHTVLRISEHDIWHRPDEVVRRFLAS